MRIPARFNGPPGSGNGGWSAGAFARACGLGGIVEVTLRVPPPLDTEMAYADGAFHAPDGTLVASVAAVDDAGEPVPPVPAGEAALASKAYPGFSGHPFPTCYVCGPERADGLRLFPGNLPDGRTAAPWTVPDDIRAETMWAALDCPGGWATDIAGRPMVLGRMALERRGDVRPGEPHVVVGWTTGGEGRKTHTATALHDADGTLLALARATWLTLPGTA